MRPLGLEDLCAVSGNFSGKWLDVGDERIQVCELLSSSFRFWVRRVKRTNDDAAGP